MEAIYNRCIRIRIGSKGYNNGENETFPLQTSQRQHYARRHQSEEEFEKTNWHHCCHASFTRAGQYEASCSETHWLLQWTNEVFSVLKENKIASDCGVDRV
jgi:hypothetical protein